MLQPLLQELCHIIHGAFTNSHVNGVLNVAKARTERLGHANQRLCVIAPVRSGAARKTDRAAQLAQWFRRKA